MQRPPPRSTLFPYTTLFRSLALQHEFPEILRRPRQVANGLWHLNDRKAVVHHVGRKLRGVPRVDAHLSNLPAALDRKSTRLNSSHVRISYAVFCLKKKNHHASDAALRSNNIVDQAPLQFFNCPVQ